MQVRVMAACMESQIDKQEYTASAQSSSRDGTGGINQPSDVCGKHRAEFSRVSADFFACNLRTGEKLPGWSFILTACSLACISWLNIFMPLYINCTFSSGAVILLSRRPLLNTTFSSSPFASKLGREHGVVE